MEPPREQVYQDHQCVAERLTFGERIGTVLDPHRRFDVIESAGSDLVKNLRGVGHPILAKVDAARTPARHRAQAVVGVSDAQSRCEACEQGRRLDQHAPRQRLVEGSPKETAAEREIGALPGQRIDQYGDVGGAVLPIGIERHDDVSPLTKRELDAGLKCGALP